MSADETIKILSTSASEHSSVFSSDVSSDSSLSSDSSDSTDNNGNEEMNAVKYAKLLESQEKARLKKRIGNLARKHEKKCKELVRETTIAIERIKEYAEESIAPSFPLPAPGNSLARRLEKAGQKIHNTNRIFFRDSERTLLAIRNTTNNRQIR